MPSGAGSEVTLPPPSSSVSARDTPKSGSEVTLLPSSSHGISGLSELTQIPPPSSIDATREARAQYVSPQCCLKQWVCVTLNLDTNGNLFFFRSEMSLPPTEASATSVAAPPPMDPEMKMKMSHLDDSDLLRAVRHCNVSRDPCKCVVKWAAVKARLVKANNAYLNFSDDQLRSRYKYVAKMRREAKLKE